LRPIITKKKMKKLLLLMTFVLSFAQLSAQRTSAWKKVADNIQDSEKIRTTSYSERQQLFQVNLVQLKEVLANAADKFSGQPGVAIEFPNSDGELEQYLVWENSNFAPELQAQYPEIRSYIGKSLSDKTATIHFSMSPLGVQTMVLRADNGSEFIEPYTNDHSVYVLFDSKTRTTQRLPFNCSTADIALADGILNNTPGMMNRSNTQSYKVLRLALSCTGEYGVYFGGTVAGATAGMNATMTRVNAIFEKDMAVHMNMIPTNNLVVYTNAGTDPYSAAGAGSGGAWNAELMNNLHSVLGDSAFDIGHLFGASGGGGNAGCIGCVCSNVLATGGGAEESYKGSGFTSPSNNVPAGDSFDIDYVIHEMGHQFGANHTFSHNTEGSGVNVEPGSGSTIMGYAGITSYDVQPHSDAYFTYRSILQVQVNLNTKTCPVSTPIVNSPPTVDAGSNYTIPKGTAFLLKGIVSDVDGDTPTSCWEPNNSAGSSASGANSVCSPTKTTGPNFRSFIPVASPNRYMPAYATVLGGSLSTMWESVNTVARTSKFTLTARDNNVTGPQTNTDETTITTSGTIGPFAVTSQNVTGTAWNTGESQTITWDVNNSNTLVGSANVNIKLSVDGGVTWPYTLAADTPNDGSEVITVPSLTPSLNCRLWIEPTANVYYAVNSTPFYIGYTVVNNCNTYTYTTPFALTNGSASYTVKSINVPTAGTISDVNITVNATHTNLQNLVMGVIRPGAGATLGVYFNQQCTGNADMNATFDQQGAAFTCASPTTGTYAPPTAFSLNTLNGFSQQGNWQFGFKDVVTGPDSGTINSITLEICSQTTVLATQNFGFEDFALYPNPNNGNFTVQFQSGSNSKINIEVHDMRGRKIFGRDYTNSGLFSQDLQLDKAQAGVYLVSITEGTKKIVKRIVIQ
jgi:subtilisin-like proprotein convertase family protein